MALISFLGVFYVFLFLILGYLYFKERDAWFKWAYFISALAVFMLLVHFTYFQTQLDNDNFIVKKTFTNGVDLDNLIQNGSHTYTTDTTYAVFNFWNIPSECVYDKENPEFCFIYNNSDVGANVVVVTNGVDEVSDYLYLMPEKYGEICVHINKSLIQHGELLGINCLDCSLSNPLNIPQFIVDSSLDLYEIHITKSNPESYSLFNSGKIHAMWVTYFIPPTIIIENNFFMFLGLLSIFVLFFLFRFVYLLVGDNLEW